VWMDPKMSVVSNSQNRESLRPNRRTMYYLHNESTRGFITMFVDLYYDIQPNLPEREVVRHHLIRDLNRISSHTPNLIRINGFHPTEIRLVDESFPSGDLEGSYPECCLRVIGDRGYLYLRDFRKLENPDFYRFLVDDIVIKTGFLGDEVGLFLADGLQLMLNHFLLYKEGYRKTKQPTGKELVALYFTWLLGLSVVTRAYADSDERLLIQGFDNEALNSYEKIKSAQHISECVVEVLRHTDDKFIRFANDMGYSVDPDRLEKVYGGRA